MEPCRPLIDWQNSGCCQANNQDVALWARPPRNTGRSQRHAECFEQLLSCLKACLSGGASWARLCFHDFNL
jgi:hypothetical protein